MKRYLPARLVRKSTWYIVFYQWDPVLGERIRFRVSNDLNRIPSIRERLKLARSIIADINRKLPFGYPFDEAAEQVKRLETPIVPAIRKALALKCVGARPATVHSYSSMVEIFIRYLEMNSLDTITVSSFTKSLAIAFLDDMDQKGISARTHNNYTRILKVIFNALVERQFLPVNPWNGIKKMTETSKKRRSITQQEAQTIVEAARRDDPPLYVAILLQYYCFLRPNELRHIRLQHFDLDNGTIRIPGAIAKNKRDNVITIPDKLVPILRSHFGRSSKICYLLGKGGGMPAIEGPIGANTMGSRHMNLIRQLKKRRQLDNIEGISYYSWKDTGARALVQAGVPIDEVMRQLRHSDLSTTQVYISSLHRINSKVKVFEGNLI